MYIPEQFEIEDEEEVFAFIEANAFGQLISTVSGRLFSSHIPFLASPDRTRIIGHLAIKNPQHADLDGQEALVTLQGPHGYVSPAWYNSPGVPTWNYQAVHIYGQCQVFHDSDRLRGVVDALTSRYEALFAVPWQPSYNDLMLSAIIGVEVTINEIQCKYKLSQNRSDKDRTQVIEQLKSSGSKELAEAMERSAL